MSYLGIFLSRSFVDGQNMTGRLQSSEISVEQHLAKPRKRAHGSFDLHAQQRALQLAIPPHGFARG
jgi:hypothetical protein